jgi:hypothetical protein
MSSTRSRMQAEAAQESTLPGSKDGAWKWAIRQRVWDYMEAADVARCVAPWGRPDVLAARGCVAGMLR